MLLDRLLSDGSAPLLEQWLNFTETRQRLLGEDIVNATTPNYVQKDLSLERFQSMLLSKARQRDESAPGTVDFSDISMDVQHPRKGLLLFHDGNNRSMEQLMSNQAKNALMHTLAVELLRRQYNTMDMALKERPG